MFSQKKVTDRLSGERKNNIIWVFGERSRAANVIFNGIRGIYVCFIDYFNVCVKEIDISRLCDGSICAENYHNLLY